MYQGQRSSEVNLGRKLKICIGPYQRCQFSEFIRNSEFLAIRKKNSEFLKKKKINFFFLDNICRKLYKMAKNEN